MQAISPSRTALSTRRVFSDPRAKIGKTTEDISISGDQFPLAGINMREGSKAIDLQFKNKLVRIEGLRTARKRIGRRLRGREHISPSLAIYGYWNSSSRSFVNTISTAPSPNTPSFGSKSGSPGDDRSNELSVIPSSEYVTVYDFPVMGSCLRKRGTGHSARFSWAN
jgi:hypothetical protein